MQQYDNVTLSAPSLPKGGGAVTGLSGQMNAAGPDGAATFSIPLPVSAGRGYAPSISLNYNSQAGNGPFGIGWSCPLSTISRRTNKGAPAFSLEDEFIGPDGEVLVPNRNAAGEWVTDERNTLLETKLDATYYVTSYRSRIESTFSVFEYWRPKLAKRNDEFWVIYQPDGQVHLLGYEASARITAPDEASHHAQWLLNASVSANGEQIYYQYETENDDNCDEQELTTHSSVHTQRYLTTIYYGNLAPGRFFCCLNGRDATAFAWFFIFVLDYGERTLSLTEPPSFGDTQRWRCRQDRFSGYEYGFEVRTRRLCHQALMFHRLTSLSGNSYKGETPALISRVLFTYSESPSVSTLIGAQQMAFERDPTNTLVALPPLTFGWQTFTEPTTPPNWQSADMGCYNKQQQPWLYVDLLGEGIAGLLYQDTGAWWYRAPVRVPDGNDINAVALDVPRPLPSLPAMQDITSTTLIDLNGEGYLQWLVTSPGLSGVYAQDEHQAGQWQRFVPLSAFPSEFHHPRAQLADIIGSGFADLVLIGPRSVRLYAGQGDHWQAGQTVFQSENIELPIPGRDATTLVAFSDPLGSGQQHLIRIRADGVTCWPNLGHGRFGKPLSLPGFSKPYQTFNPDQVYLADIDGSGAVDIIYAQKNHLEVYRNLSGNGFAAPFSVSLPAGVCYDNTCQLDVADVQGLGVASLLLTVPHPVPQHYVLALTQVKPWLLNNINNNMGSNQTLRYRSSVQYWLDQKQQAAQSGETLPRCTLPFALHLLWQIENEDEITGAHLVSEMRYRHGAWDGGEREFRGFGYVEAQDTTLTTHDSEASHITRPLLSCSWFFTGVDDIDARLPAEWWHQDDDAFDLQPPRYTMGDGENEALCSSEILATHEKWLQRALKGLLLRSEQFGLNDVGEKQPTPYSVQTQRPQIRFIADSHGTAAVWPSIIERLVYSYEEVKSDPQCLQQLTLTSDAYGIPLRTVTVHYPRRPQPTVNPYPDYLPETLFANSYDEQQRLLRLRLEQHSVHHLIDPQEDIRVLGVPSATRSDVFTFTASSVPKGGLTLEQLIGSFSLLNDVSAKSFAGQTQTYWVNRNGGATTDDIAFPPRMFYAESSEFNDAIIGELTTQYPDLDIITLLDEAGYQQRAYLFASGAELGQTLWVRRTGATYYGNKAYFWFPIGYHDNALSGRNTLTWDNVVCVISEHEDAAGGVIRATYDWRFLSPVTVTDVNRNTHEVAFDALGRVSSRRFYGTEQGQAAGYSNSAFIAPMSAEEALSLTAPLPVAQSFTYVADSWMNAMKGGRRKAQHPPHVVTLTTDRYDSDPAQQIRQQVMLMDGFGRELQTAVRHEAGEAWSRLADGRLAVDASGNPLVVQALRRWAVSGKTEYDNKGNPIRTYQPYFLDDWRYVSDDSARNDLYSDTHFYDPLGRVYQVKTAKGWLRRTLTTPWFVVNEDENDTASELSDER